MHKGIRTSDRHELGNVVLVDDDKVIAILGVVKEKEYNLPHSVVAEFDCAEPILEDMVAMNLTTISVSNAGRTVVQYRISKKGLEILHGVLEPYESLFPRQGRGNQTPGPNSKLVEKASHNLAYPQFG